MENIDIDMIIDVPDTPNRVSERRFIARESDGMENLSAMVGRSRDVCLVDQDYFHYLGGRGRCLPEARQNSRHHLHPQRNSNSQTEDRNDLRASGNTALFRRTAVEKDKGKAICSRLSPTSNPSVQKDQALNLNQCNGRSHSLEKTALKSLPYEDIKENGGSSMGGAQNSFKTVRNSNKGKEKLDDSAVKIACTASDRERHNNDTQHKKEDRILPIIRAPGQRKLVRNGCISPQGIAARAKQVEQHQISSKDNVKDQSGKERMTLDDQPSINITEIVAEEDNSSRAKGKRPINHPHISKDKGTRVTECPTSVNGTRVGSRGMLESEGWRCTRNQQMTTGRSQLDVRHNISQRHETNRRDEKASQRTFRFVSRHEEVHEQCPFDREASKRPRRNGFTSAVHVESENSLLGTCREASSSRPLEIQDQHGRGMQNAVVDISDSSPEVRPNCSQLTRGVENDESDAKARQVEADEILACELQEQLYQEALLHGNAEIDRNIAQMLQQEENSRRASSSQRPQGVNPIPTNPFGRRRLRTRLQQSSSGRRPNLPQARASVRMTQTTGRRLGSSNIASHQALDLQFPADMVLETRLDILEELETAFVQLGNSSSRNLLGLDRDFNEDDYEMLLALDDNNHQHGGASVHQINSLPESKVQTDNFEETCAVCLETPTTGDVIRHLPCLHKFHKDCIDPWLQRSKSCPICKSSIT